MGLTAALKLRQVAGNLEGVLALELLCAAQGIDFRREEMGPETRLGSGTAPLYDALRRTIPFVEQDVYLKAHIDAAAEVVNEFVAALQDNRNGQ